MLKKLLAFVCGIVPAGAFAATENIPVTDVKDLAGYNAIESSTAGIVMDDSVSVATNQIVAVQDNGIAALTVKDTLDVAGDMRVFDTALAQSGGGTLFIDNKVSNTFSLQMGGDLTIGGGLTVGATDNAARTFNITNYYGDTFNVLIDGSVDVFGTLTVTGVNDFESGAIDVDGVIDVVAANDITVDAVTVASGSATFKAMDTLTIVGALQNNGVAGTDVVLSGAEISVADIQNNASGKMDVTVSGNLTATGVVENKGQSLTIDATGAAVVIDGTMTNETGNMIVKADSLTVGGGDANNASFVNKADLSLTVSGAASFANGINLDMSEEHWGDFFYMKVGSLDFGDGDTTAFFANNLNDYDVIVDSAFSTSDISNGSQNVNANMYLAAAGLTVEDVTNNAGTMKLVASNSTNLTANSVTDSATAKTDLFSDGGTVSVTNDVIASGTMTLSGQQVLVGGVVGKGGSLVVTGSAGESGLVTVNKDITNANGNVKLSGRQIKVLGNITNNSGTVTVGGSDLQESAIHLGGVNVVNGVVNLNGLLGVDIAQKTVEDNTFGTGTLNVSGGVLNIGSATHALTINGPTGNSGFVVDIAGNVIATGVQGVAGTGDVYVAAYGNQGFLLDAKGAVNIDGSILANASDAVARTLNFATNSLQVGGNVTATGSNNRIVFQGLLNPDDDVIPVGKVMVDGVLSASNSGAVEIHSTDISVGKLTESSGAIYVYGNDTAQMAVSGGGVSISSGIAYGASGATNKGLIIANTPVFSLVSQTPNADITTDIDISGGIELGNAGRLNLQSVRDIQIAGLITSGGYLDIDAGGDANILNNVTVDSQMDVTAKNIDMADLNNNGTVNLTANGDINIGILENTENAVGLDIDVYGDIYVTSIESVAGDVDIIANTLDVDNGLDITGGTFSLEVSKAEFGGDVNVSGVLNQGVNETGMLNLTGNDFTFNAVNLTTGGFVADSNTVTYNITNDVTINGNMTIGEISVATVNIDADAFYNTSDDEDNLYTFRNNAAFKLDARDVATFDNVINSGALVIDAAKGITMAAVQNSGTLSLDSGADIIDMASLEINGGRITVSGAGWNIDSALYTTGMLYQNYAGTLSDNDINVSANDYSITASSVTVAGISQAAGTTMNILSSDVTVNGDINTTDLTIAANPDTDWLDLSVGGSILGNTKIYNLEQMTVGGNYVFDSNSQLLAAILPYNVTPGINSTTRNYWSTVSTNEDDTLGQITNADDGAALIQVVGKFTSGTQYDSSLTLNSTLADGQIGLRFQDVSNISAETAIWLLQAEQGLSEFSNLEKIRNLNVLFCNAGNTTCVLLNEDNLGAYISVRDTDASGSADSLYVVFDPRFGGPVLIEDNRIQPIVARQPEYTDGEYVAAGALDNLISGQLLNTGFFNKSPIEIIPAIFDGTNVETLMTELYNRMEYHVETSDGSVFLPFSRLVQPREIEQIAGAIALNEHTAARNFEDRMIDEFIWNRNRNLKKVWADFDFGMFSQNVSDDKRVYGNRFELSGGFDWQESDTLIVGLTGRVSHMSSDNSDAMDLGYIPGQSIAGNVSVDVADTNIGLGAYLMKALGQKFRAYGNVFVDLHLIDTTRHQTFMDVIEGSGTALALTTEWGLMHDWLNQYVVGNLYARAGYNFGFSVTEEAAGENYMDLESDGYFMLTPGYSLTAQKRIYPSAWFQVRPYATIGIEYDVLGVPDFAKYKFASANAFSEYDIAIDPLWANIGGGFEFLSANGLQFGIDYRYQYNNDMQLHNIKVSGSYRF